MNYTFICDTSKEWYLKISSFEQLLDFWKYLFNPRLKQALDTIEETKEYGKTMQHCDIFQMLIGQTAKGESLSYKDAYEKIVYDYRIKQYQELYNGKIIYINRKFAWNTEPKKTEQFIHKKDLYFPIMTYENIKIKQFPMGTHFYVFIDGIQLRKNDNLKFNTYKDAFLYAEKYIK